MVEEGGESRADLRSRLEYEGFEVVAVDAREAAISAASSAPPDLVILDLRPPAPAALEFCRSIRTRADAPDLAILVVSGRGEPVESLLASEDGADDFISVPFEASELIVRAKSLLRRAVRKRSPETLRAGTIELDRERYLASVGNRPLRLTSKEFELLRVLMQAEGRVLRREVLLEQVWGYDRDSGIESRTLDVHIRGLRRKLGREGRRIVTLRGVGYRLSLVAEWIKFGSELPGQAR